MSLYLVLIVNLLNERKLLALKKEKGSPFRKYQSGTFFLLAIDQDHEKKCQNPQNFRFLVCEEKIKFNPRLDPIFFCYEIATKNDLCALILCSPVTFFIEITSFFVCTLESAKMRKQFEIFLYLLA